MMTIMASVAMMAQNPLEQLVTKTSGNKIEHFDINASSAQHRAMPVYSDELIDEAPAGKVVNGCQRSGYSYFYSGGSLQGGYNDGFVGEYILGDDGCIYIKEACASLKAGTYLKLDKIDDENYVAHTSQLIYVYDSGNTIYSYFATRLVFKDYGDNQFGYALETDENGKELCDIYFTYKDGVLMQKDQTVNELNGVVYPHELIAFTNSTGGWIGYGDGCLIFTNPATAPNTVPAGAEIKDGSFSYSTMSSITGQNVRHAIMTQYAEVGDDFYFLNPTDNKNWIKGQIDRNANTVTFLPQYVGVNDAINCHQWFAPAKYNDWRDVWDEEDNIGTWVRDFSSTEKYVCKYDNGSVVSDLESNQTMVISLSDQALQTSGSYSLFCVRPYEHKLSKPATPTILRFEPLEETFFFAELVFAMPSTDENDTYIPGEELYFRMYINGTEPYLFSTDVFDKIPESTTDISYLYDDDYEFDMNGSFHNIYFYDGGVKYIGIQSVHKLNGQEMTSDIAWYGDVPSGISGVVADSAVSTTKVLDNGRIIIMKNGVKYNVNGQILK